MESKKVTRAEVRLMAKMAREGMKPKQIKDATGRDYNTIKYYVRIAGKQTLFNVHQRENWLI